MDLRFARYKQPCTWWLYASKFMVYLIEFSANCVCSDVLCIIYTRRNALEFSRQKIACSVWLFAQFARVSVEHCWCKRPLQHLVRLHRSLHALYTSITWCQAGITVWFVRKAMCFVRGGLRVSNDGGNRYRKEPRVLWEKCSPRIFFHRIYTHFFYSRSKCGLCSKIIATSTNLSRGRRQ